MTFLSVVWKRHEVQLLQRSTYAQLGWCSYVRACVRASRWKKMFTPYLVVELSPSAEIWCVYVTSINDGTQILTFLGIHNIRDFQNSRFFRGDLIISKAELHWFLFSDRFQSLHSFPELCTHSQVKRNISVGYSQWYLCLGCICSGWESLLYGIAQFRKIWSWCSVRRVFPFITFDFGFRFLGEE